MEAKLGILFVHGIGEQPQGQTLWLFGEPMVRWLNSWLKRDRAAGPADEPVKITESIVNPAQRQVSDPAHARVQITLPTPEGTAQKWLLAESWWGGELQRPAFRKVATWMLTTGTWMIVSHFLWRSRLRKKGAWLRVRQVLAATSSLLVAGLTQLGVLVLMVLALIPVQKLQEVLSGLLLRVTGVLGDSYIFVENRIQQAAIITKAKEDLQWLASRCETVVVIAHSQGAAVAHRALRTLEPSNVKLLVTVGSGLAKLEELESLGEKHGGKLRWTAASILLTILAALVSVRSQAYPLQIDLPQWIQLPLWFHLSGIVTWTFGFSAFVFLVVTVILVADFASGMQKGIGGLTLRSCRPDLKWFDVYASRDPVPNGPLARDGDIKGFESAAVTNGMSLVQDHNGYWENSAELIPKIFAKMDSELNLGLFQNPNECNLLDSAAVVHRWRVTLKVVAFWTTVLSAAVFVGRLWDPLVCLGWERVWPLLNDGALKYVAKLLHSVGEFIGSVLTLVIKMSPVQLHTLGMGLLGVTVPLGLIMIWYLGFSRLWAWWDGMGTRQIFDPRPTASRKGVFEIVGAIVAAIGFLPLFLAILHIVKREWLESRLEERLLLVLGTALAAWMVFVFLWTIVSLSLSLIRSPAERKKNALALLYMGGMALFLFLYTVSSGPQSSLEEFKRWAGTAFIFGMTATVFVLWHWSLLKTALSTGRRRTLWWITLLLPLGLPAFMFFRLWLLSRSLAPDTSRILALSASLYPWGLGFAWLVVKLAARKASKALKAEAQTGKRGAPGGQGQGESQKSGSDDVIRTGGEQLDRPQQK